ncbi:hypothetical protein LINPERHAP2_LOCUS19864 [Linum perenne]
MADYANDGALVVQFTTDGLWDARERSELSLLDHIFWDEPHELGCSSRRTRTRSKDRSTTPMQTRRGRGNLPPSVAARLTSNLQGNGIEAATWEEGMGRRGGMAAGGLRPLLALPVP